MDDEIPDFDDPGYDEWLAEELEAIRDNETHERRAIARGELLTQEQLN